MKHPEITNIIFVKKFEDLEKEYEAHIDSIIYSTDVEEIKKNVNSIINLLDQGIDIRKTNKLSCNMPFVLFAKIADQKVLPVSFIKENIPDSRIDDFMKALFTYFGLHTDSFAFLLSDCQLYRDYIETIKLILKGSHGDEYSMIRLLSPETVKDLTELLFYEQIDFSPNSLDLELLQKLNVNVQSDSALSKYDFFILNEKYHEFIMYFRLSIFQNLLQLANLPVHIISDLENLPPSTKEVVILTAEHGSDDQVDYNLGDKSFLESLKKLLLAINGKQQEKVTILVDVCHGNYLMNPRLWMESQENHKANLSIYTLSDSPISFLHANKACFETFFELLNTPKEKADTVNFADIFIENYRKAVILHNSGEQRYNPINFDFKKGKFYGSDGINTYGFKDLSLDLQYQNCRFDLSDIYRDFNDAWFSSQEQDALVYYAIPYIEYMKYLSEHGVDTTKEHILESNQFDQLLSMYTTEIFLYYETDISDYDLLIDSMASLNHKLKYYFACGINIGTKDDQHNLNILEMFEHQASKIINSKEKIKLFDIKDNDNNITYEDIYKFLTGAKINESKETLVYNVLKETTEDQKEQLKNVLQISFELKDWIEKKLYCFKDWKEVVALDETDNLQQLQQEQGNNEHIAQQVSDDFQQEGNVQIIGISDTNGMANMEFQG